MGTSGEKRGLTLCIENRSLDNDLFGLTHQRQAGDDPSGKAPGTQGIKILVNLCLVVDSIAVQEDSDSPLELKNEVSVIGKGTNAWSIARERYNHPGTVYVFPDGRKLRGDQIREWSKIPVGTEVLLSDGEPEQEFEGFLEIGKDGTTVRGLAGDAFADSTTIYFLPNGYIRTGAELARSPGLKKYLDAPPKGTRILVGYVYGGYVRARRSAYYIARTKWNYPSTFYRFPDGRILSGDEVDENSIPSRTLIFFQH